MDSRPSFVESNSGFVDSNPSFVESNPSFVESNAGFVDENHRLGIELNNLQSLIMNNQFEVRSYFRSVF